MAANPTDLTGNEHYYNKVVYGGKTLIDLTGDTVRTDTLLTGYVAHNAAGMPIEGNCKFDADTSGCTVTASEILAGKSAWANAKRLVGTMPNIGGHTATISTVDGAASIPAGYHDGSGKVTIDSTEQSKIIAANIKEGVEILGVTGTCAPASGVKAQAKTATPTVAGSTVLPDSGYDYLSQVTVGKIPYVESSNTAGGVTVTIG